MLFNKLSVDHLILNALSVFVFAALAMLFLQYATKKLTLLGGEDAIPLEIMSNSKMDVQAVSIATFGMPLFQ